MTDKALEALLSLTIDTYLLAGETLSFTNLLSVSWSCNVWSINASAATPLAMLLADKNPERITEGRDDVAVSTLAKLIDRSPAWINSFLCGWAGLSNSSSSISGFVVGDRLRRAYCKEKAADEEV